MFIPEPWNGNKSPTFFMLIFSATRVNANFNPNLMTSVSLASWISMIDMKHSRIRQGQKLFSRLLKAVAWKDEFQLELRLWMQVLTACVIYSPVRETMAWKHE